MTPERAVEIAMGPQHARVDFEPEFGLGACTLDDAGNPSRGFAAAKRGVTRLRRHTHDVRAMSACVPTADISLNRGGAVLLVVTPNEAI